MTSLLYDLRLPLEGKLSRRATPFETDEVLFNNNHARMYDASSVLTPLRAMPFRR